MKTILTFSTLCFFLFSSQIHAQVLGTKSINPNRVVTPLFQVFRHYTVRSNTVSVTGISYNKYDQTYDEYGNNFTISEDLFLTLQERAKSIYMTNSGDANDASGSAVHIGENFVLTAQHVLSTSRQNTKKCANFKVRLHKNQRHKWVHCKKVHFCNPNVDYCLIEMKPHKRGYSLAQDRPVKIPQGKSFFPSENSILTSVGNPQGYGIHAARGRGLEEKIGLMLFYAPVFPGHSGGAVLNSEGELVGTIRSQSIEVISDEAYNVAVPLDRIKKELGFVLPKNHKARKLLSIENI